MRKVNFFFIFLGLIIPIFIIFKSLFLPGPLAWGDAPYFYPDNLVELFQRPLSWDFRNSNFGLPQAPVLWLYIPTFTLGLLHNFFGLNHEVLIRIVFYFPAVIMAVCGGYFLAAEYTKNRLGRILAAVFYGSNNYFLLLLDGGQIGLALGYGLFPLVILAFKKYLHHESFRNYFLIYRNELLKPRAYFIKKGGGFTEASIIRYSPNEITVNTASRSKDLNSLTLSEVYSKGWSAYLDGKIKVPVQEKPNALRLVDIYQDTNFVVFKYQPQSFYLGALITGLALVLSILLFCFNKEI